MELENTFTLPTGIDEAWVAFNDPRRFAPCFPGAKLESCDEDSFVGMVKVKVGPISLTYKGKGTYVERDEATHKVIIDASGRDARGNSTASATVTGTLTADGPSRTSVTMVTDLTVTGRQAQFGRGMMVDVSNKIIEQFASCLGDRLGPMAEVRSMSSARSVSLRAVSGGRGSAGSGTTGVPALAAASSTPPARTGPVTNGSGPRLVSVPTYREVDAIDLLDSARPPLLKRLVPPVLAGLLVAFVVLRWIKNR